MNYKEIWETIDRMDQDFLEVGIELGMDEQSLRDRLQLNSDEIEARRIYRENYEKGYLEAEATSPAALVEYTNTHRLLGYKKRKESHE